MTGFGDASAELDGVRYTVEIRSLNNRYFKPVIKLADAVGALEPEIETMLRAKLHRGSITFILKMKMQTAEAAFDVNEAALKSYLEAVTHLADEQIHDGRRYVMVDVAALMSLPGVVQEPSEEAEQLDRHRPVIFEATQRAIDKLMKMRAAEGIALREDLLKHVNVIRQSLEAIQSHGPGALADYHRKLIGRVNDILGSTGIQVSEPDLLREIAVYAERTDVSEEIQRLKHHTLSFEKALESGDQAGRKLDFITQEMLREANTIGSKANDATIAGHVVDVKGAIDRLKEQVQNVE
ncbi:MAG: YicC/YloC family endoribonuclease [Phycisphaerae bacterium]